MEELIEKYRNLAQRQRLALVFFVAIAYPALIYVEEIEALTESLEAAERAEYSAVGNLRKAQHKVKNLPKLQKEVSLLQSELADAKAYLPDRVQFDRLLSVFGRLERRLGVQITHFKPGEIEQGDGLQSYSEVPLEMELRGEFGRVMLLLDKVVHRKELVHIRSVEINRLNDLPRGRDNVRRKKPATKVRANVRFTFFIRNTR